LLPDGTLTGDMEEVRTGYEAWKMRTTLIHSESHKSAPARSLTKRRKSHALKFLHVSLRHSSI
jgi:hypothetical protein